MESVSQKPTYQITFTDVQQALEHPRPGLRAQGVMAPLYDLQNPQDRTPSPCPKEASVLILLYTWGETLYFPLTRRSDALEDHKGQISLPGGARENQEPLCMTALRETCEELRIPSDDWSLLGQLSPLYIPPSDFMIYPFVAQTHKRPPFYPNPVEVAELIETPLALLLDPRTITYETWKIRGQAVRVPFFHIYGHKVWGATAMVLSELVHMLREVLP